MSNNFERNLNVSFVDNGAIIHYTDQTNGAYRTEVFVKQSAFIKRLKELGDQLSPLAIPKDNQ